MGQEFRFISQLRKLLRSYDRLLRGVGSIEQSEKLANVELERLLALLHAEWAGDLGKFLLAARDQLADELEQRKLAQSLLTDPTLMEQERRIMSEVESDLEQLLAYSALYFDNSSQARGTPQTVQDIEQQLRELHSVALQTAQDSRALSRKPKKRRKRQIAQGLASLVCAIGAFGLNSKIVYLPSYAVGGGALIQATRDIIGTSE